MLPSLSAVALVATVGLVALGSAGRAGSDSALRRDELHVSKLHVAVSAMPASERQAVFTGVLPGYHRNELGSIENIACVFAADLEAHCRR